MVTPNSLGGATFTLYGGAVKLPPHDYEAYTYISSGVANDDSVATIIGYSGGVNGSAVGTLTFTYWGSTNNIKTVALTLPTATG